MVRQGLKVRTVQQLTSGNNNQNMINHDLTPSKSNSSLTSSMKQEIVGRT